MNEYAHRYLPEAFLSVGPYGLQWWQWIAIGALVLAAVLLGRLLAITTIAVLKRVARRTQTQWDDRLLAAATGPAALLWALLLFQIALPAAALEPEASSVVARITGTLLFVALYWAAIRGTRVAEEILVATERARGDDHLRVFIPQVARIARGLLFTIFVVSVLAHLGYHVTSLITGLGVGGIALALAARSTIENLFASFTLAADRPFELGDLVRIDGHLGHVEALGLRSTRLRTLDRSLINFPNSMLTDSKVETLAARERIRLDAEIGLVYDTTAAQLETVLAGFEDVIREHPKAHQDRVIVRFEEFGDSSLNIEVMCWFETQDNDEFRDCRQEVLLGFMRIVEEAGTDFAFPTQTVHLASTAAAAVG
jgi:MscS family membrane protein